MTKTEEIMALHDAAATEFVQHGHYHPMLEKRAALKSAIEKLVADANAIRTKERERCAKVCTDMQGGWASSDHLDCAEEIRSLE